MGKNIRLNNPRPNEDKSLSKAAAKRRQSKETIDEAWQRIFAMKNSPTDEVRLKSVKQAMAKGIIGRDPNSTGKRFSKAEALRLWTELEELERRNRLKELVDNMPDNYRLVTSEHSFYEMVDTLAKEDLIVFDVETTGTDVYSDKIVGHVLSATSVDMHYYVPTGHDVNPAHQLTKKSLDVAEELRPIYEDDSIKKIAHNAKYDIQMLKNDLDIELKGLYWDTMEAMRLLNENEPTYALKPLATKYLRDNSYTYGELFGQVGFNEIDLRTALAYAAKDGDLTYKLYKFQRHHLAKHGNMLDYFLNVEMPLMSIVSDIELRGYDIDTDHAKQYAEELRKQASKAHDNVVKHLGDINLNSPEQLKDAIEAHIGRSIKDTNAKNTLKPLAKEFPVISDLLEYREITKLLSTYYDALPQLINPKTGRIHTRLNQNGAKTGRFSSGGGGSFNIQNQSGDARKMFVAPEGHYIVNADFAAQEVRIIASLSQEEVLLDAFARGVDAYATLASRFFGKPYEECYKLPDGSDTPERSQMKVVLLSSMYGASKFGLSRTLGISVDEAEEFRQTFFDTYKKIGAFIDKAQAFAKRNGFVWIGDKARKRRLPDARKRPKRIPYGKYWDKAYETDRKHNSSINQAMRQAPNAMVQGLAAIQTKVTMIELDKLVKARGWQWFAPIHDEIVLYTGDDLSAEDIAEIDRIMTQSYLLDGVDNATDIEIQRRWGESITAEEYLNGKEVPGL